jgi:putative acetyltransferase
MTARPQTKLAMRPMLPADVPILADIFRASIEELSADDYTEAQQAAWASAADDEEEFAARISGELTLVATLSGDPIGFACLAGNSRIDMLYVETLAAARGTKELSVDASDSARGFFERRGFVAKTRNSVSVGDEWLANTTMVKSLPARARGTLQ